ncbi:hypothetical protein HPB50_012948 [Hyalomma asiaticum]|uniref:Uncharacterized protein n=1 Tax=Hyalomma asiaticum TaxID=266040 RepID=A0ACB7RW01_HYAAI|nr:hypothetical protein HPB50_012948 [Hyalomma asiaticum]
MVPAENTGSSCVSAILWSFMLALTYVGSLYIWRTRDHRDHPATIKKRFISVFAIICISPLFVVFGADLGHFKKNASVPAVMGLRLAGLLQAIVLPLALTMAPLSEEFTFRACMLPILVPCLGHRAAVVICPLFFGVAHFHHLTERLSRTNNVKLAVMQSVFQFAYTTIFGAYSVYLFLRTGHFVAPFVAHAFCNHMGFPDVSEVFGYKQPRLTLLLLAFFLGLLSWASLLEPMTRPQIYSNDLYYQPL